MLGKKPVLERKGRILPSGSLLSVVLVDEDGVHIRDGAVTAWLLTVEAELEKLLVEWAGQLNVDRSSIVVTCLEPQDSPLGSLFDDPAA